MSLILNDQNLQYNFIQVVLENLSNVCYFARIGHLFKKVKIITLKQIPEGLLGMKSSGTISLRTTHLNFSYKAKFYKRLAFDLPF